MVEELSIPASRQAEDSRRERVAAAHTEVERVVNKGSAGQLVVGMGTADELMVGRAIEDEMTEGTVIEDEMAVDKATGDETTYSWTEAGTDRCTRNPEADNAQPEEAEGCHRTAADDAEEEEDRHSIPRVVVQEAASPSAGSASAMSALAGTAKCRHARGGTLAIGWGHGIAPPLPEDSPGEAGQAEDILTCWPIDRILAEGP